MRGEQAEQSSRGLVGRVFSETGSGQQIIYSGSRVINWSFWETGNVQRARQSLASKVKSRLVEERRQGVC